MNTYRDLLVPPPRIEDATDEEILALSLRQPTYFSVLVERYQEPFTRRARYIVGPVPEVEDIVQDALTKLYVHGRKFEKQEGASFKSWAYKILHNTAYTYYKKMKKAGTHNLHLETEVWAMMTDGATPTEKRDVRETIMLVLAKMPERLARVLNLHFLEDLPQEEVATRLGISVAAVKTRVHRAKKEFRKIHLKLVAV